MFQWLKEKNIIPNIDMNILRQNISSFDDVNIGIAVNPKSVDEITSAIEKIHSNYNFFLPKDQSFLERFKWNNIAKKYIALYEEVLSN